MCYVLLESEAGSECRVVNPWPGEGVVVTRGDGEQVEHSTQGEEIRFPTDPTECYFISPAGVDLIDRENARLTSGLADAPRFGIGGSVERGRTGEPEGRAP